MTTTKQYKIGLTEVLVIFQVAILLLWFWQLSLLTPIDRFSIIPFQAFGWLTSLGLIILALVKLKDLQKGLYKAIRILLVLIAFVIFYFTDKLADRYPDQYRFSINNRTGLTLDRLTIQNRDQVSVDKLLTNANAKLKLYYSEGMSLYMIIKHSDKLDTTYLPIGGTNSIGYIYNIDLKIKGNKVTAEIDEGKKSN